MWGMTQGTQSTKNARKPGQTLLKWGAGILALGLVLLVIGFTSTEVTRGVRTTTGPTPIAWIATIAGVALIAWGFGKRLLGATEKD